MKIEKAGTLPKEQPQEVPPAWWVGKRAECPRCRCVVTLQAGDAPGHFVNFKLRCPTRGCGQYIVITPQYDRTGKIG